MMVIELTGDIEQIVSASDVGHITKQGEEESFEYVVDDFTFTLLDGAAIMAAVENSGTVNCRVYNLDDGVEYFKGIVTSEGTSYSEDESVYQIRAVQETKSLYDAWRNTPSRLWYYNKYQAGDWDFVDPAYFPNSYLAQVLAENTGFAILLPDIYRISDITLNNKRSADLKDDAYTVYDLVKGAAEFTNSIVWPAIDRVGIRFPVGTSYLLFQNRDYNRGRDVGLDDATVSRFIKRLRAPQYRAVIYQTDKGNFAIESKDSYRIVKTYDDIDTDGMLDLTGLNKDLALKWNDHNSRGGINPQGTAPLNYLFPRRSETRQNTWNDLLRITAEFELGIDRFVPLDVLDRVYYKIYRAMKTHKIEYDIVNETTIITATL